MKDTIIGKIKIGKDHSPFIVAEMSGNHNRSLDRAIEIVKAAANSGVHAVKLQTYTADTITIDVRKKDFFIKDEKSLWKGNYLYDLYKEAYTPWEWHKPIFKLCKKLGMIGFSTPFDESAVDFLESLGAPCYKIASFENIDLPLIRRVALTKKPMIISTGMASFSELKETVHVARKYGCKDIILLKCTSAYPAGVETSNIATIPHMRKFFDCPVGLSDHTLGIGAAIAGVVTGACVIEKHFTLSRNDGGVDSAFSLEPREMEELVLESRHAWQSIGRVSYGPTKGEKKSLAFRRSLYIVEDMKKGEMFTENNLRSIRPGYGLPPKYYDSLLGQRANKNLKRGTPVSWAFVSGGRK